MQILPKLQFYTVTRYFTKNFPRIIMYHGFSEFDDDPYCTSIDNFKRQLSYFKKHYQLVKLCDLIEYHTTEGKFLPRTIVLTVDDGYENFFKLAMPILMEFQIPATVFVVSDLIEDNSWIWTDKFKYLCDKAKNVQALSNKNRALTLHYLKSLPVIERDLKMTELASEGKVNIPDFAPEKYALMSWKQINEIISTGLIEIGSHSCTHPILAYVNKEDSWSEIHNSRNKISNKLDISIQSFCYPNGKPEDYREDQLEMLSVAGYKCATASHFGYVSKKSNIFALPRIGGDILNFNSFLKYLDGLEYFIR